MKRCISAIAASLLLALAGGVTKAYADDSVGSIVQPAAGVVSTGAPAASQVTQPVAPVTQQAAPTPNQAPTSTATPTSSTPAPGYSQSGPQGQSNYGPSQISVPIESPATQVNIANDNQVLTAESHNGDFEANNQSQEIGQSSSPSSTQHGQSSPGGTCCQKPDGDSRSSSKHEGSNGTKQILVPIASPATQVNIANDNQVLTYKSSNGDFEANNQSQEVNGGGSPKGGKDGYDGCKPKCESGPSRYEGHSSKNSGGTEQILVPIASPATQVNAFNDNQVLTYKSHNGDFEANNQSQEVNGGGSPKGGKDGYDGCKSKCESGPSRYEGHSSKNSGGTEQILVPIASPATQVNAFNDNQVLTYKSHNGDFEANNQSQEVNGGGSPKGGKDGYDGCKSKCESGPSRYEGHSSKNSGGTEQILVPIASPA